MAWLFTSDAIAELWKPQPSAALVRWIPRIHRREQYLSAVSLSELYALAFEAEEPERALDILETRTRPEFTILPMDEDVSRVAAKLRVQMGERLSPYEIQVAATALRFGLALVTTTPKRFAKVPGLEISKVLSEDAAPARRNDRRDRPTA